jgi:hypothetical protein
MNPFKAMFGREAPTIMKCEKVGSRVHEVDKLLGERDTILDELKKHLSKGHNI